VLRKEIEPGRMSEMLAREGLIEKGLLVKDLQKVVSDPSSTSTCVT
jgi:hypothetical protein